MAKFQFNNPEQFISLVNLLSLRNGGQLQPSIREEHQDDIPCDDKFKQRFLDKFAEMMSRDKGGKYVCCVALRESGDNRLTEDIKTSLIVARNVDFNNVDEKFRSKLEGLLSAIAASAYRDSNDTCSVEELWEELLSYNQPRLDCYADSLRESLKAFKAAGSLDSIPPYYSPRLSQNNDSEDGTFRDDSSIGPYSEATHVDYMRFARNHILELDAILRTGDKATQRRSLAERTYSIRHMKSVRMFINSHPKVSLGRGLLSDILFLGRLRSCFYTLVEAALSFPGFAHLSIIFVRNTPRRVCSATLPSLADAMKFLGQTLNPTSVNKFISEKLGVINADRAFKKLQNTISRQHLPTHAEVQLVLHIVRTMDIKTVNKEVHPYIGCSKLSCFLCSTFLEFFDPNGVTFKTRGSHGKIYTLWSIPDMDGLRTETIIALHSALKKTQKLLVCEMMKPITTTAHVAESTAGLTDYTPQSSFVHQYHKILATQREFDALHTKNLTKNSGPVEDVEADDVPGTSERSEILRLSGECRNCERETTRRCSKCRGPWLCSERCEDEWGCYGHTFNCAIGRPLDTADYLVRACWTDSPDDLDEDTKEDFGFTNFASAQDVFKLLRVYAYLVCFMGVGSRELHKWQEEGTLTENIIAKYEVIPEGSRGGYYPWFRQNLHVLNSRGGPPDFFAVARPYLDQEDREKGPHQLVPEAKRKSFVLYALLLNGYHPDPSIESEKDLYFEFGFVTGCGSEGELVLPWVYQSLIPRCSFTEFWTAFESNNLVALMDAKGLEPMRREVQHLETFMKINSNEPCPTVWRLRLFVHSPDVDPLPSVAVDYGFFNCRTVEEKFALRGVYKELLESPSVDPMKLHAACIKGELYGFAREHKPNLQQRFKRIMTNCYPLPDDTESVGASSSCLTFFVLFCFVSVPFMYFWG
ncbi:hypothetical protein EDD17DRAFT_234075 [Pisolithus thermaeus]|nr:hypothetical protein EV401DRAFT_952245 [Pisolithus croceorrhizus]KAI6165507.1 hypothetical protein EDD17DRAFT_234075 [Pisolithus thermaeus]